MNSVATLGTGDNDSHEYVNTGFSSCAAGKNETAGLMRRGAGLINELIR